MHNGRRKHQGPSRAATLNRGLTQLTDHTSITNTLSFPRVLELSEQLLNAASRSLDTSIMPFLNSEPRYTALSNDESQDTRSEKHNDEDIRLTLRPQRWWQRSLWFIHLFLAVLWTLGFTALVSQGTSYAEHRNPDADSKQSHGLSFALSTCLLGTNSM